MQQTRQFQEAPGKVEVCMVAGFYIDMRFEDWHVENQGDKYQTWGTRRAGP